MKIKLQYPVVDVDGEAFEELSFRRPTVKDMKVMDGVKGEIEKTAVLIGRIATNQSGTQLSSIVVDRIDAEDFAKIAELIGSFFEKPPQTGEK
jgi:hypothetical protein